MLLEKFGPVINLYNSGNYRVFQKAKKLVVN